MEPPLAAPGKRVLEFYSGIGALKAVDPSVRVMEAFDINTFVNRIYEWNFKRAPLSKNLERITAATLDSHSLAMVQPVVLAEYLNFVLVGNQRDDEDPRTKSLLVLLKLFAEVNKPPTYLMIENVSGFQTSRTREQVVAALTARNYALQEVMLSPSDIGIPNSRLRYFLLAKRRPLILKPFVIPTKVECFELSTILETATSDNDKHLDAFLVPANTVAQQGALFDVVRSTDRRSCCFTKAYGRYVEGTGSVLQTNPAPREGDLQDLRLRYLTPREIARLHCFPDDYGFPSDVTVKQQWKALGNSLNVRVVAELLRTLFDDK